MKTILTNYDIKNIMENMFNSLTDTINIVDEDNNVIKQNVTISSYLEPKFYEYREDLKRVDLENDAYNYLTALAQTQEATFGLCEIVGTTVTTSQDIDSGSIEANITFLTNANKIAVLENAIALLRQYYAGNKQTIVNSYSKNIDCYINLNTFTYDTEPTISALGEIITATLNISISYLSSASTYNDETYKIGYSEGSLYDIPYSKMSFVNSYSGTTHILQALPNLSGNINSSNTLSITLTLWLFNDNTFLSLLNHNEMVNGAYKVNNVLNTIKPLNEPIYLEITKGNNTYLYRLNKTMFKKEYTNADYTICTLQLIQNAK